MDSDQHHWGMEFNMITASGVQQSGTINPGNGVVWVSKDVLGDSGAPPGAVSSVFGRAGVVVAASNDYSFTQLSGSLAATQLPALTGDVTTSAGSAATTLKNTGTAGTYGSVTTDAQGRVTAGTIISGVANGGTGVATITGLIKGAGTSAFVAATAGTDYQAPITLTTTGSSGAATFIGGTLNIPQYSGGGSSAFNAITSGTNTSAAMHVGSGSALDATGSGTITATAVPASGVTGTLAVGSGGTGAVTLTGLIKGNGTSAFTAATAGMDYLAPFGSQTANFFYAAPNGSAGVPSFRAIVAADIPMLNQNTTGSSGTVATISGLVAAGANITITGAGTSGSPYSIAASGSGSSSNSATFALAGSLTVGNDVTSNWYICQQAGTFTKAFAIAKAGPTGAALIFDILKSSNNGSTFTSLWASTPANQIQIAAGQVAGSQTSFDTTTYAAGDLLRIDVNQVGSTIAGANVTVKLGM